MISSSPGVFERICTVYIFYCIGTALKLNAENSKSENINYVPLDKKQLIFTSKMLSSKNDCFFQENDRARCFVSNDCYVLCHPSFFF